MKHQYIFWEQLQKLLARLEAHFSYRLLHTFLRQLLTGKIALLENKQTVISLICFRNDFQLSQKNDFFLIVVFSF